MYRSSLTLAFVVLYSAAGAASDLSSVYVAPGGRHLRVISEGAGWCARLGDDRPSHGMWPSADVLFESASAAAGSRCAAVVLTGMGTDAVRGCRAVRREQGRIVVQAPHDCTVSGMTAAVIADGHVDHVGTLAQIARVLVEWCDRWL